MLSLGAVDVDRGAVGAQQVVRGDRRLEEAAVARGQHAVEVAAVRDDPGLVQRRPHPHPAVERAEHHARVLGEPAGDVAVLPAAAVLEGRGQVPVEERRVGLDAGLAEGVHEPAVEVEALLVDPAGALGQHARPGDAEAVGVQPELLHPADVVLPEAVVVAGHVARVAALDEPGRAAEAVPVRRSRAVGERRALDLVRGRRGAPEKSVRKRPRPARHRFGRRATCRRSAARGARGSRRA